MMCNVFFKILSSINIIIVTVFSHDNIRFSDYIFYETNVFYCFFRLIFIWVGSLLLIIFFLFFYFSYLLYIVFALFIPLIFFFLLTILGIHFLILLMVQHLID